MPPYIDLDNLPSAAVMPTYRRPVRPESDNSSGNLGCWATFLRELIGAGPIRIGTSRPAVALNHKGNWPDTRIQDSMGIASGRRFTLRMVLGHWSHLEASRTDATDRDRRGEISILDRQGVPVLDLGFGEDRRGIVLDMLTRHPGLCRGSLGSAPAPKRTEDAEEIDGDPHPGLMEELGDSGDAVDLAEATGRLRLNPARLRERGCANAVDAALVPCFLEALAEQALPIRVTTGTAGVAQSLDCAFFCHRRDGVRQTLRSDSARFRVDTSKIDSAWILRVSNKARERTSLRLYDARGRLSATIGSVPGFGAGENPIWRTLLNALQD